MNRLFAFALSVILLSGCNDTKKVDETEPQGKTIILAGGTGDQVAEAPEEEPAAEEKAVVYKTLEIRWVRFINSRGQTCVRSRETGKELHMAVNILNDILKPKGVEVVLKEEELNPGSMPQNIFESNRVWIGGIPMEDLVGGKAGKSYCNGCGDEVGEISECRAIMIDELRYEVLPVDLLVKGGLAAAEKVFDLKGLEPPKPTAPRPGEKTITGDRPDLNQGSGTCSQSCGGDEDEVKK